MNTAICSLNVRGTRNKDQRTEGPESRLDKSLADALIEEVLIEYTKFFKIFDEIEQT
jgi:hypothetical protein